jgi:hypothetical protein
MGDRGLPASGERRRVRGEAHGEKSRIGDQAEGDAAVPVQRLGIPVDLHETAGGRERRHAAEAHGEVEPLAQEEDEVRLAEAVARHVEPRIVDAARAFNG